MFYVDGLEMGHLHGDSIADLQFPSKVGKKLVNEGRMVGIIKKGWCLSLYPEIAIPPIAALNG